MITEKHCTVKVLLTIWEIFLHTNNCNYNSFNFNYKFSFILFFEKLKTRIKFSASWRSCNKKYFCFLFIASRFISKPCQIQDFYSCSCYILFHGSHQSWKILEFGWNFGKVLEKSWNFFVVKQSKRDFLVNTSIFRAFSLCWI